MSAGREIPAHRAGNEITAEREGAFICDPGIYALAAEVYHSDPCPEPSLSGSVAIPLVHRSPLHAWWNHPRLNPDFEREESSRLDVGSIAHKLLLGKGADVVVIDAEGFQTKAAREARDNARAAGKLPVLSGVYENIRQMTDMAGAFLDDALPKWRCGKPEQVLIWREQGAWCRGMVDMLSDDRCVVLDYKTTSASARPDDVERQLFDMHYHLKAAFYERGLNVLDPENVNRRDFLFLFQETDPPFACSLIRLSEGAMTIGRKQATYAIRRWARCIAANDWPGYGGVPHRASPPPWVEQRWMSREMSDPDATGETYPGETMPVYAINGGAGFQ